MKITEYLNKELNLNNKDIYKKIKKMKFENVNDFYISSKYIEEINSVLIVIKTKISPIKYNYLTQVISFKNKFYVFNKTKWIHTQYLTIKYTNKVNENLFKMICKNKKVFDLRTNYITEINESNYATSFKTQAFSEIGFPSVLLPRFFLEKESVPLDLFSDINKTEEKNEKNSIYKYIPMEKVDEMVKIEDSKFNEIKKENFLYCTITIHKNNPLLRFFIVSKKEYFEFFRIYYDGEIFKYYYEINNIFYKLVERHIRSFETFEFNDLFENLLKSFDKIDCFYIDEEIFTKTKIKFFNEITKDKIMKDKIKISLILLQFPFLEKLYKSDYFKHYNYLLNVILYNYKSYKNALNELFKAELKIYEDNDNIVNSLDILGLNKYQSNKVRKYIKDNDDIEIIAKIKNIFNLNNISFIDNKTFDKYFDFLQKLYKFNTSSFIISIIGEILHYLTKRYSLKTSFEIILDIIKEKPDNFTIHNYKDILMMLDNMNQLSAYNLKISTEEQINILHNEIIISYKAEQNKELEENFEKVKNDAKKYEYSEKSFSIISPNEISDIAIESKTLSHCVIMYVPKIVKKECFILFLRKNDNITEPFYTIEVSPKNKIIQIKGKNNKNIDNKNISNFIKRWAEKKNITYEKDLF